MLENFEIIVVVTCGTEKKKNKQEVEVKVVLSFFGSEKKREGEILSVRKKRKSANRCGLSSITSYLINSRMWDLKILIPR